MSRGQPRVLIVEDEEEIRESLADLLEDEGFTVFTAADGQHALRSLRDGLCPDLIVLDLMMPSMNGWEFREQQRSDPAFASIPVIVLSGVASVRVEAERLGAADFASKPISSKRLIDLIARHLRRATPGS